MGFGRLRGWSSAGGEVQTWQLDRRMKISYLAIGVNEHTGNARMLGHTEEIHLSARQVKRRSLELRNERLVERSFAQGR